MEIFYPVILDTTRQKVFISKYQLIDLRPEKTQAEVQKNQLTWKKMVYYEMIKMIAQYQRLQNYHQLCKMSGFHLN